MTCAVPLAISNGYYVGAKVSYTTGDVIQYVCNTDYVMSGSPVATCDASGNWTLASGTLPECNNSYFTNGKISCFPKIFFTINFHNVLFAS